MKYLDLRFVVVFALVGGSAIPAAAIDCSIATSAVDKVICNDPEAKAADAALSDAYFKLLRSTKGTDAHDTLIASQRRWLKARREQQGLDSARDGKQSRAGRDRHAAQAITALNNRQKQACAHRVFS